MGAVASTNIITDGLMGCWDAANKRSYPGTGTTWTDIVGGNNATLINMEGEADSGFESQKMGVMAFDGTDAYANIGDVDALTDPTTATASVWFRREGETASYGGILAAQFRWGFIYFNSGDELKSYAWLCTAMDGYTVTAGWHQAVTTWTASGGSNSASFYVDGILISQGQICYNMDAGGELEIGRSDTLTPSQYFDGDITAIYIHDRVLTAAEVLQNYEATRPRFEPRITKSNLELNLDAGDPASYVGGTTWKDTANGYNATLVNTIYSSEGGGSVDLDGTDDSVTISSNAAGDFSMKGWSILTYEFWIKRTDTTGWGRLLYESTRNLGGFLVGPAFSGSNYYAYIDTDDGSSGSAISGWGSTTDWIHLATTYDGSDVVTYRNGVQVGTQSLTGDIKDTSGSYGGVVFGRTNHGGSDWFDGRVATIRVYQAALSVAEILDNYNKTKGRFGH